MAGELPAHKNPEGEVFGLVGSIMPSDSGNLFVKRTGDSLDTGWEFAGATGAMSPTEVILSVTNSGAGAYILGGASNPTLSFIRGYRYIINVNALGHPFWIQTVAGGYSAGNIYGDGVTNNGTAVGTIIFDVPHDAPANLYYACQYHLSMAGAILMSS